MPDRLETRRVFRQRLVAERDLGDAAKQRHRADRHHDRRHGKHRHQRAVERAAEGANAEADDNQRRRRRSGLRGEAHRQGSDRDDRRDRQVDFTGDDQKRHRQREDGLLREIERRVGEIVEIEKVRRNARVEDNDADQQQDKNRFPAQENVGKSNRRAVGDFVARR